MRFQSSRPRSIFLFLFLPRVLPAIHFDDQSMSKTTEVHDVIANRVLAAELRAIEAFGAEVLPEETFGGGLFASEAAAIST